MKALHKKTQSGQHSRARTDRRTRQRKSAKAALENGNGNGNGNGHVQNPVVFSPPSPAVAGAAPAASSTMAAGAVAAAAVAPAAAPAPALSPTPLNLQEALRVVLAQVAAESRYNSGARFDAGAKYVGDVPPFEPGNAKVVMDLYAMNDLKLADYSYMVIENLTGNAYFPETDPPLAELITATNAYTDAITAHKAAMEMAKTAKKYKDDMRAAEEVLLRRLQNSVQLTSKGNAMVINSAGMSVRRTPTKAGELDAPSNLVVNPGPSPRMLDLSWDLVTGAKGYIVRCASVQTPGDPLVWNTLKATTKRKLRLEDLESGKTYIFQVAATGGSTGQGLWCPEVSRMCA